MYCNVFITPPEEVSPVSGRGFAVRTEFRFRAIKENTKVSNYQPKTQSASFP